MNVVAVKASMSNENQLAEIITKNYFELFNLPTQFEIDLKSLGVTYRELQTISHPDRFALVSDHLERLAIQATTHINTAYNNLKSNVERAIYILKLQNIDVLDAQNTKVSLDFLEEQLEWRDLLAVAKSKKDVESIENLLEMVNDKNKDLNKILSNLLDNNKNYNESLDYVRQLIFVEKLESEIEQILADIEDEI